MLVKKVKTVGPDNGEPSTEERYILTADIDRMAELVGLPSDIVRAVIKEALNYPNATYYGEARSADYFQHQCNVWETVAPHPRKLELDNIHLRVSDRIKTDASNSFLIVPVSVMNPGFVGDASIGYELIPHIVMETWPEQNYHDITSVVSVFHPLEDSFITECLSKSSSTMGFRLVGFDLLLMSAPDKLPGNVQITGRIHTTAQLQLYRDPNVMVYDFGFGITLQAEINVEADMVTLTAMRNGAQLVPSCRKCMTLVNRRLAVAPHDLLSDVGGIGQMSAWTSEEIAKQYEATPQDHAVLRWLIERVNDGYTGLGWRN